MADLDPTFSNDGGNAAHEAWQRRLLPLLIRMVVGLTLFFFVASVGQLAYLYWHLNQEPPSALATWAENSAEQHPELELAVLLESDLVMRRYRMAATLMMAQLWIRYLGFVTGMIMSAIGCTFVLGKLREPRSTVGAESAAVRLTVTTTSPGLLLAALGSILMLATILTKQETWVSDTAVYLPGTTRGEARTGTEIGDSLREQLSKIQGTDETE